MSASARAFARQSGKSGTPSPGYRPASHDADVAAGAMRLCAVIGGGGGSSDWLSVVTENVRVVSLEVV